MRPCRGVYIRRGNLILDSHLPAVLNLLERQHSPDWLEVG